MPRCRAIRRLSVLALAAPLLLPPRARAQTDGRAVALVISGGASLGVYEAGYTYALGEVLKRQGDTLRVATGASAGSGNALLSALSSCTPPNDFPTRDPGYRFWLAQQFDSVFRPAATTAVSAFTPASGLADLRRALAQVWRDRLPASCDVSVGITVTRLIPLDVTLKDELTVPRQLLYFTLRIRGRGDSLPPVIENIVDPGSRAPRLLLPVTRDSTTATGTSGDRDALVQVIGASGAFPFAFPPVRLAYCIYPTVAPAACREAGGPPADSGGPGRAVHHDLFIDGGVFDNIPLGLASTLSLSRPGTRYVYLDPDLRAYPVAAPRVAASSSDALDYAALMVEGFFTHARKTELYALLQGRSAVLDTSRLFLASNRFPQAGGFLGNFFGLFEREFRRFDFYLGMYDALHDLGSWPTLPTAQGRRSFEALLSTPEFLPLRCLRAWYDSSAATPPPDCDGDDLRDFRILAQVAIDRVYSQCRALDLELPPRALDSIPHGHCRRATHGALPPAFAPTVRPLDSTRVLRDTARGESELDYDLRLLAAYGFEFHDLGLPRREAGRARQALGRRLGAVIDLLATRQPSATLRRLLRLGQVALGEYLYYEPPPSWDYLVVGTVQEVGTSHAVTGLPGWLRLDAALRVQGVISLLTRDPNEFAVGVFAGPDFELRPLTAVGRMLTIAPRVGYKLSQGDRFGAAACGAARTHGDGRDCTQVVLQAAMSYIFYDRVRLQASFDYFPRKVDFDNRSYDIELALGVEW
jgi:Patatin-like phospholipase